MAGRRVLHIEGRRGDIVVREKLSDEGEVTYVVVNALERWVGTVIAFV